MSYYLSILVKPNNMRLSFMEVIFDTKWIYCLSNDKSIVDLFKTFILCNTPPEYMQFLDVVTGEITELTQAELDINGYRPNLYTLDRFYIEGIVNGQSEPCYSLEEFTIKVWRWWPFLDENGMYYHMDENGNRFYFDIISGNALMYGY